MWPPSTTLSHEPNIIHTAENTRRTASHLVPAGDAPIANMRPRKKLNMIDYSSKALYHPNTNRYNIWVYPELMLQVLASLGCLPVHPSCVYQLQLVAVVGARRHSTQQHLSLSRRPRASLSGQPYTQLGDRWPWNEDLPTTAVRRHHPSHLGPYTHVHADTHARTHTQTHTHTLQT